MGIVTGSSHLDYCYSNNIVTSDYSQLEYCQNWYFKYNLGKNVIEFAALHALLSPLKVLPFAGLAVNIVFGPFLIPQVFGKLTEINKYLSKTNPSFTAPSGTEFLDGFLYNFELAHRISEVILLVLNIIPVVNFFGYFLELGSIFTDYIFVILQVIFAFSFDSRKYSIWY